MQTKIITLLTLLFLIAGFAHADILIEPYAGYGVGKSDNGTDKKTAKGYELGGRLGVQKMGLMGGLDYQTGKFTQSSPDVDYTGSNLYVFLGFNFPVLLRVYGEYGLMTKVHMVSSDPTIDADADLKGDSYKLGVGFTGFPLISINLEYQYMKLDHLTGKLLGVENLDEALDPKTELKTYMLSVSVPLTF